MNDNLDNIRAQSKLSDKDQIGIVPRTSTNEEHQALAAEEGNLIDDVDSQPSSSIIPPVEISEHAVNPQPRSECRREHEVLGSDTTDSVTNQSSASLDACAKTHLLL